MFGFQCVGSFLKCQALMVLQNLIVEDQSGRDMPKF